MWSREKCARWCVGLGSRAAGVCSLVRGVFVCAVVGDAPLRVLSSFSLLGINSSLALVVHLRSAYVYAYVVCLPTALVFDRQLSTSGARLARRNGFLAGSGAYWAQRVGSDYCQPCCSTAIDPERGATSSRQEQIVVKRSGRLNWAAMHAGGGGRVPIGGGGRGAAGCLFGSSRWR